MLLDQQPAWILHARPWRETSLLLECLTRDHGRVGMVARGVRRTRVRLSASMLQPFQPLVLSYIQRGELGTLRAAEPVARALMLEGNALLAGLYVNELVVRLSARQDPYGGLHDLYARTVHALGGSVALAWTLRRFERDFLQALGYAMQLDGDALDGTPLVPDRHYRYVPEEGPVPAAGDGQGLVVRGSDLIALGADRKPDAAALERLRRLQRGLLLHQLGGVPLRSWQVFAGVGNGGRR